MRNLAWGAVAVALLLASSGCKTPPPPVMSPLGAYELVDSQGQPFGSRELAGKPYVVSFFFTSCPSICPKIIGAVRGLQTALAEDGSDARLVSITVDPETDDPARLRTYATDHGADPARWHFLTGTPKAVREAVVEVLMNPMGGREDAGGGLYDIAHGARLLLVDGQGRLRGLHETDEAGLADLLDAIDALGAE